MKKEKKKKKEKHDPKTCFRCRLMAMMMEIYPNGPKEDVKFIVASLAEITAILLSGMNDNDIQKYMLYILKEIFDNKQKRGEFFNYPPTKH